MSLHRLPVRDCKPKNRESIHPWTKTIKRKYLNKIKRAHNSIRNMVYPSPKEKTLGEHRVTFTVIGNRVTKEFIYCAQMAKTLYKYRSKQYNPPVIQECTAIEWFSIKLHDLKMQYGSKTCGLQGQAAVLFNDQFLGGEKEMKEFIDKTYRLSMPIDYEKQSIWNFATFVKASGRPTAYMHISIDGKPVGSMIFLLYSDIVPETCENFLRLCHLRRGGYSGTPVHRIVKDGWIQCGGFNLKDTPMSCENFIIPHDKRGVLGMANNGRHTDCSTQFYVLLLPNDFLNKRFVAFGQLIDGEDTLKKIEEVNTFYESPTVSIIINRAGILNLNCQDIVINKGTRDYLNAHIENLLQLQGILKTMLWDFFCLEIEFRRQLIETLWEKVSNEIEIIECGTSAVEGLGKSLNEPEDNRNKRDVHKTSRFIHKNYEIPKSERKSQDQIKDRVSKANAEINEVPGEAMVYENQQFDVEDLTYEPEEYSYDQVIPSASTSTAWPPHPYYLALTDVPYPGEVDSTFDLKRLLKGDYCLESDLKKHKTLKLGKSIPETKSLLLDILRDDEDIERTSLDLQDLTETKEMKNYLSENMENFSLAGHVVENIGHQNLNANPLKKQQKEKFTDEDIRRIRTALRNLSTGNKYVRLNVPPKPAPKPIKRKMTPFIRPEDIVTALQRHNLNAEESSENVKKSRYKLKPKVSTLHRLISQVAKNEDAPTLKDYKPSSDKLETNKKSTTIISSVKKEPVSENAFDIKRKSISRPFITIEDYKKMNEEKRLSQTEYQKKELEPRRSALMKLSQTEPEKKVSEPLRSALSIEGSGMGGASIRMPGDTPLYSPVISEVINKNP